jgi:hypothetical protein
MSRLILPRSYLLPIEREWERELVAVQAKLAETRAGLIRPRDGDRDLFSAYQEATLRARDVTRELDDVRTKMRDGFA